MEGEGSAWLVGRSEEVERLAGLLVPGGLVTVTGPGGVGKTSLATVATSRLAASARVAVADLSAIEDPAAVEPVIAAALGHQTFDAVSTGSLADGSVVVVDNCEHVLDAVAGAIASLRAVLPRIAVCATSRQPLGLRDELVLPLPPLGLPPDAVADPDAPAVAMFLAVAERAGGPVRDGELGVVGHLCRRLDGVPLAIEIAATRTRSMSPTEILDRLGDRLDELAQGGFRRDERQRSVRGTVEWSYRLLDPGDRALFDRLGVLAGSFSWRLAHAVSDDPTPEDTLDHLDRLVAASLLSTRRGLDGSTWYAQLQAVRACGRDHLAARDELESTMERFVDHMVESARELAGHAVGGWSTATIVSITALQESLLHALRWVLVHDEGPGRAFELMAVLWGHQFRTDELLALGERVLDRWPDRRLPRWADAAATVATCHWITGRWDEAEALIERALEVADRGESAPVLLRRTTGRIRRGQGRIDEAIDWFAAASAEAERLGLRALVHDAELMRAAALAARGDVDDAIAVCHAVREMTIAGSDETSEALVLSVESDATLWKDPAEGVELARSGIELARRSAYPAAIVGFGRTLALGLAMQGRLGAAAQAAHDALDVMLRHAALSQARSVLEAAAVIAHRAGDERWNRLARTAATVPSTHLLTRADHLLPGPPAEDGPVDELGSALVVAGEVMLEVARSGRTPTGRSAEAVPPVPDEPDRWRRRGDHWDIAFGGTAVVVRHTKGLGDLARLLAAPDREIPAFELIGGAVEATDTGAVLDGPARREYEQRLRELHDEIAEAEDDNDLGRAGLLTEEFDALVEQLTTAVGLGGRGRRAGSNAERARTAVTRRIRNAISHLADVHPELGRHLDVSIHTGTYCRYRPERPVSWHVSA